MKSEARTESQFINELERRLAILEESNDYLRRELDRRIRSEEALKKSEANFRFLVENMHDILWTVDLEMNTTYVSPSVTKILGFTPEERMRQKASDQLAPASFESAMSILKDELRHDLEEGPRSDGTMTLDLDFFKKDGSTVCLETVMSFIRNSDAKPIGVCGFSRDVTDRKRAEEALRESEERVRAIVETVPACIFLKDLDFTYAHVNPHFEKLFGIPAAQLVGITDEELFGREAANHVKKSDRRVFRGEIVEEECTRPVGGVPRTFHVIKAPLRDDKGGIAGLCGIARDVTERRNVERALEESEQRYKQLAENSLTGIFIHQEGARVYANRRLGEITGHAPEELLEMALLDPVHPEDWDMVTEKTTERGLAENFERRHEFRVVSKNGEVKWVEILATAITYDGREAVMGNVLDITERRRAQEMLKKSYDELERRVAERTAALLDANKKLQDEIATRRRVESALRESEKRYRSLFEHSPISLWEEDFSDLKSYLDDLRDSGVGDPEKYFSRRPDDLVECAAKVRILDVNEATLKLYKADGKDVFSQGLEKMFCEESLEALRDQCNAIWHGRTAFEAESMNQTFLMEKRNIYLKWSVVPGHEERYSKVLVSVSDITDLKQAQEKLADALRIAGMLRADAEAASRAKSEFLANMSHEFRTPLNAIIGFSEILEDQELGEMNPTQIKYLGHIANSGRRLLHLINNVLDLAKLESGRMKLQTALLSPDQLIRSSLLRIRGDALKHNLRLDLQVDEDLLKETIHADEIKLKQILANLLSNSIKFTPDGGHITVQASKVWENMVVRISDTGAGLDTKDCERIFGTFEQLDSSLTRKQDGTGLGLALTKKLVELHGGRIWAHSAGIGKGSTFTFVIPIRDGTETAGQGPVRVAPADETEGPEGGDAKDLLEDSWVKFQLGLTRDHLTGLWNRSAVVDMLEREMARSERDRAFVGVIAAGIDGFEEVTDSRGYLAGETLLREVAKKIIAEIRSYDYLGRYSSNELLIVLPGCGIEASRKTAARLQSAFSGKPLQTPTGTFTISLSLGVGASRGGKASGNTVITDVLETLQRARDKGGNNFQVTGTPSQTHRDQAGKQS
ncbi:MAG: PAS domain S-box protein [Pseudomonadota bacterium]